MSFCCCGAEPSYPHDQDCPFPYYGMDPYTTKAWDIEYRAKKEARLKREHPSWFVSICIRVDTQDRTKAMEKLMEYIFSEDFNEDNLIITPDTEEQNGTSDDLIK